MGEAATPFLCISLFSMFPLRPLEDELSAVTSEPKRSAQEPAFAVQASETQTVQKGTPSLLPSGPLALSHTPAESSDLFVGCSETQPKEAQSRKRKGIEAELQIEELESIMSEDMDCFDGELSSYQRQQEKPVARSLVKQKPGHHTVNSSSKRQRVHMEENGTSHQKPQGSPESKSSFQKNHSERSQQRFISIKTEQVTTTHEPSKPEISAASTSKNINPPEDDDGSLIEVRKDSLVL